MPLPDYDYVELAGMLGITGRVRRNQLYALCPLHDDSSPSFDMDVETGEWTCHKGCGPESGRSFPRLVMLVLDCTWRDAVVWVARNGGSVPLPIDALRQRIDAQTASLGMNLARDTDTFPAHDAECAAYWQGCAAGEMPVWFVRRGFNWETIAQAGIRYDALHDGVVIPVRWQSALVGLVVRYGDGAPLRYWNSPRLPRNRILYGLGSQAHDGTIILVEGPLDALWIQQELSRPAVACFGSDVSDEQIQLLRKHSIANITLAFDNDAPGRAATIKTSQKLFKHGWLSPQIKQANWIPGRKDANQCTQAELKHILIQGVKSCLV